MRNQIWMAVILLNLGLLACNLQAAQPTATPASTLTRAREIGLREGLQYVYTGNVHDTQGGTTSCPACGEDLVVRDWHRILRYHLTGDGRCLSCAAQIPGRFEAFKGQFGRQRIPVRVGAVR